MKMPNERSRPLTHGLLPALAACGLAFSHRLLDFPRVPGVLDLAHGLPHLAAIAAGYGLWELSRFALAGALVAGAATRMHPASRWARLGLVALAVVGLALAASIPAGRYAPVWPLGLLRSACAGLGALAVEVWRAGPRGRRLGLVGLIVTPAAVAGAAVAILVAASVPATTAHRALAPPSAEKRRLYRTILARDPRDIPPGQTHRLRLTSADLNTLLDWSLVAAGSAADGDVALGPGALNLELQLPLTRSRSLGLSACVRPDDRGRTLPVTVDELALGRLRVPSWIARAAVASVGAILAAEPNTAKLLAAFERVEIDAAAVTAVYGRADIPKQMLGEILHGPRSGAERTALTRVYALHLLDGLGSLPPGTARAAACVQRVFALARERSASGDVVEENRAAVVALGILLGHWKVETLVGRVLEPYHRERARIPLGRVLLHGRPDWTRHFFVSAALAALSAQAISDEAGLFKEELDADGGSGFSFADLLADRAGTTFALGAIDPGTARAQQAALAAGVRLEDYMPDPSGLPEGIADAELQTRYGGVHGELYRRYRDDVERRIVAMSRRGPAR